MHPFAPQWNHNTDLYPRVAELLEGRKVVLDVGCGDGTLARFLASRGHQVLGIDRDPDVLPVDGEGTHFELADAANLPYGYDSFDAVVAVAMLHHSATPGLVLGEMRRVLKRDGLIVIVGLAADKTVQDRARSAKDLVAEKWAARGKTRWESEAPTVDPTLGWDETRALIEDYLEGATWERTGFFRYVATWTASGGAQTPT